MSSSALNLEKYRIPLAEIHRVTGDFGDKTLIGDGGFGLVHVGQLSEEWGNRTVAIKRLNRDGHQGNKEFHNELKMVSSFHHPNIIPFSGYCDEADEMIIIYDYAKNGSLDRHFQKPEKMRSLNWTQRLKICLGTAKGLQYLHSGLGEHNRVIHRDVKSANILLDDNLEAKICDFGLSRFGARNELEDSQILTRAAGTRYYMDPLYAERSRLTKESDVYSLGVVMFEMSSGTLVYHEKCFGSDTKPQYLMDVVRSCYDDDNKASGPDKLIDPIIRDHVDMKSFDTFSRIAHECLNLKLQERPTMLRVIRKIEQALKIQLDHESPSTITTPNLESFLIPLEEINLATQHFNKETHIVSDDFGAVHRGQLYSRWENRVMAINRLYPKSYNGEPGFYNAVRAICGVDHQNISPFIGYSDQGEEKIIVHEYAVNGCVADYLNADGQTRRLTWAQRLKICVGTARGLHCLQSARGKDNWRTRGHINCRNILLDETLEAKISFFGNLSRQGSMDPKPDKYMAELQKSDMYSFGVILFELLSGCRASSLNAKFINQPDQFYDKSDKLDEFIDKDIRHEIDSRCLKIFREMTYLCVMRDNTGAWRGSPGVSRPPVDRPRFIYLSEVIERLEDAADFQGVEV